MHTQHALQMTRRKLEGKQSITFPSENVHLQLSPAVREAQPSVIHVSHQNKGLLKSRLLQIPAVHRSTGKSTHPTFSLARFVAMQNLLDTVLIQPISPYHRSHSLPDVLSPGPGPPSSLSLRLLSHALLNLSVCGSISIGRGLRQSTTWNYSGCSSLTCDSRLK